MAINDAELAVPATEQEEARSSSSPPLWLPVSAFVGSVVEGACAILVASASVKTLAGVSIVAAAVKGSRLHSDVVRIPVLLASAVLAIILLVVLWNAWRSRNQSAARWRRKPLTLREKLSFAVTLLASMLTLVLVIAEIIEHPIFPVH